MNLPKQIDKLFGTNDEENIKLARNIIIQKTNEENVIAFICILKAHSKYYICKEDAVCASINATLSSRINESLPHGDVNYDMPMLLRWALQIFKSIDNIEFAHHSYLAYIAQLVDVEINELQKTDEGHGLLEKNKTSQDVSSDADDLPF